jgi:hypothetical protein
MQIQLESCRLTNMSVAAHLKVQIPVLGEQHAKPHALPATALIHYEDKIVLCVGRDKCRAYGEKGPLVLRLHAIAQDVAPDAVSDILSHVVLPICTLQENDMRVGEPRSPIAGPLDEVRAALLCCQEPPEEPFGNVLDLPVGVGAVVEVNEVLSLSEWFAGADRVDRSSLVKVLSDKHNKT